MIINTYVIQLSVDNNRFPMALINSQLLHLKLRNVL